MPKIFKYEVTPPIAHPQPPPHHAGFLRLTWWTRGDDIICWSSSSRTVVRDRSRDITWSWKDNKNDVKRYITLPLTNSGTLDRGRGSTLSSCVHCPGITYSLNTFRRMFIDTFGNKLIAFNQTNKTTFWKPPSMLGPWIVFCLPVSQSTITVEALNCHEKRIAFILRYGCWFGGIWVVAFSFISLITLIT